jgi:hypothetical protein
MPIYHFHSANGQREPDLEGMELADDCAAQMAAVQYAGDVLRSDGPSVWSHGHWRVEVTNGDGELLFTVITLGVDAPKPKRLAAQA